MMALDLLGYLDRQTSFPPPSRNHIRACKYRNQSDLSFPREIFAAAVARRRWDMALDLAMAMGRSIPTLARRAVRSRMVRLRASVPALRPGPASYLP